MEINNRTIRLNERPNGLPEKKIWSFNEENFDLKLNVCLLYTSPSPRDKRQSRMPSSA